MAPYLLYTLLEGDSNKPIWPWTPIQALISYIADCSTDLAQENCFYIFLNS